MRGCAQLCACRLEPATNTHRSALILSIERKLLAAPIDAGGTKTWSNPVATMLAALHEHRTLTLHTTSTWRRDHGENYKLAKYTEHLQATTIPAPSHEVRNGLVSYPLCGGS